MRGSFRVTSASPSPIGASSRFLFERVGRAPEELLFVDDSPANVRASEALGMPAIHYTPGLDLEGELKARGALT